MQKRQVNVTDPLGVHARPAARLADLAHRYKSNVSLSFKGRTANARHIVAVMLLSASVGSTITIETSGPDEREAIDAFSSLISGPFAGKPAP
jgi:phosphocarrier protein